MQNRAARIISHASYYNWHDTDILFANLRILKFDVIYRYFRKVYVLAS